MFLFKVNTAQKIATIKAFREASHSVYSENFSLKFTKDLVENGFRVQNDPVMLQKAVMLIAGAHDAISGCYSGNPGGEPIKASFNVTIEIVATRPEPVNLGYPEFMSR